MLQYQKMNEKKKHRFDSAVHRENTKKLTGNILDKGTASRDSRGKTVAAQINGDSTKRLTRTK